MPENLRRSKENLDDWIGQRLDANNGEPTWPVLLGIHYAFHCNDEDFDGGLSFIRALIRKLGNFHPEWNYEQLQNRIQIAEFPQMEFVLVIQAMLADPNDIAYYGI